MSDVRGGAETQVEGLVAADSPIVGSPVLGGGRASSALPTAMSADGDAVAQWLNRNGAAIVGLLNHLGLVGDPYSLVNKNAQYTTQQTGTVLWAPTSGKKLVITSFDIICTGTTEGDVQLYFGTSGDTTFTRGTDRALFDGHFIPSASIAPGVSRSGIWIAGAADDNLHVTDSAAINALTVNVWGYEI